MSVFGCVESHKGFYVGDICYAMREDLYDNVWGKQCHYEDGIFEAEGYRFAVAGTAYGDGTYYDSNGREYGVDAGVIGVVPLELVDESRIERGYIWGGHIFNNTTECFFDAGEGIFDIEMNNGCYVHLNTRDEEDEGYEDEEDEEESDDE